MSPGWVVVVPVKPLGMAKSRLVRSDRAALALAMATDTVAAARAAGAEVVVVTDDPHAAAVLAGPGVRVVADEPDAGLNPAVAHGAAVATARWPDRGVAALAADLPALQAEELRRALSAAAAHERALVADAAGTGTVLLTARPGAALRPSFGRVSRAAHVAAGARDLTDDLGAGVAGLRRDVDTLEDLRTALVLGVGPATWRLIGR
ncbi:MAG TPA: 2-phospho-L-lactate guanylyltransferase [Frankiaceae bacterium]|nr:2-phospho-L-lactate guanylyltransferase [Frankiaceae bacterium]